MQSDTRATLAQATELLAAAVRLIHAACGESLAVKIATQLVEEHAKACTYERAIWEARESVKH